MLSWQPWRFRWGSPTKIQPQPQIWTKLFPTILKHVTQQDKTHEKKYHRNPVLVDFIILPSKGSIIPIMYGYIINFLEFQLPSCSPNVPNLTFVCLLKLTPPKFNIAPGPRKMVVGRLLSFSEGNFSGVMINFERVLLCHKSCHKSSSKNPPAAEGPPYLPAPLRKW